MSWSGGATKRVEHAGVVVFAVDDDDDDDDDVYCSQ